MNFPAHPFEIVASFLRNRSLIYQLTKRDVIGRYKGSVIGIIWSLLNPLLMLTVYTFVFSTIFQARWGANTSESKGEFAIILFSGMIVYSIFSECLNRAPSIVLSNVSYVKKVVFPLEILAWSTLGSALFHFSISLIILICAMVLMGKPLAWSIFLLPLTILPLLFLTLGLSWFLSAAGVYIRDITQTTSIFTTVLMFLSPVFYPISALPIEYRRYLTLNPLANAIEQSRQVLIFQGSPDFQMLGIHLLLGLSAAWSGFWWFQKTRKGFADVL